MGTRLGFLSVLPPTESSIRLRVLGCLELVSKVLASGLAQCSVLWRVGVTSSCCFMGAVIPTGNAASKSGEALVSEGDADPAFRSMKMATAAGSRRAAAALIVSMATGSRARGVASLGVEAWLVSVS